MMTFFEAIAMALGGKKVRQPDWIAGYYLTMKTVKDKKLFLIKDAKGKMSDLSFVLWPDHVSDDWEYLKEEEYVDKSKK
jgi:hypothetical protein